MTLLCHKLECMPIRIFQNISDLKIAYRYVYKIGFLHGSVGKEVACNAGDMGLIPGSGRYPGERNGNSLQYSCLENPMDRGAWQATVHGVARFGLDLVTKPPQPYTYTHIYIYIYMYVYTHTYTHTYTYTYISENAMAPHSSALA